MATRARVVQMEQPATTGGNALLILVGLSVVFLLIVALLGAGKAGGSLFSESNLLYVALIFYAGAGALYMGFGVTGTARYVKFASTATVIGFAANTLAVAHRWYLAGRPPFASIYEMLLSFVWTVALLTLITEKKFGVPHHRQHHHAAGGGLRDPDATAALGSAAPGSGAAINLAACSRHAGDAGLCGVRRELCAGHDVPHPGQLPERHLPGMDQRDGQRDLHCDRRDPLRPGRTQRHRMGSHDKVGYVPWPRYATVCLPCLILAGSSHGRCRRNRSSGALPNARWKKD